MDFNLNKNEVFYAFVTNAETAAEAVQQGYALLAEVGDDLWPACRRRLLEAVRRLEEALASFEADPWQPPRIEKVTLIKK